MTWLLARRLLFLSVLHLALSHDAEAADPEWIRQADQFAAAGQWNDAYVQINNQIIQAVEKLNEHLASVETRLPLRDADASQRLEAEESIVRYVETTYSLPFHHALTWACQWHSRVQNAEGPPEVRQVLAEEIARRSAPWAFNVKGVAREAIANRILSRPGFTPVGLPAVRQALAQRFPEGVLVHFVLFRRLDQGAEDVGTPWYAAWVTDGSRTWMVDLGSAVPINVAANDLFAAMLGTRPVLNQDRMTWEASSPLTIVQRHLRAVRERIMPETLFSRLSVDGNAGRGNPTRWWVLAPAAEIWLVPFAAIPVGTPEEPTYAVEKYRISYVVTARDLVGAPVARSRQAHPYPVVIGDPNYNDSSALQDIRPPRTRVSSERPIHEQFFADVSTPPAASVFQLTGLRGKRRWHCQPPARCATPAPVQRKPSKGHLLGQELANSPRGREESSPILGASGTFSRRINTRDIALRIAMQLADVEPKEVAPTVLPELPGVTVKLDSEANEPAVTKLIGPPLVVVCTHGFAPGALTNDSVDRPPSEDRSIAVRLKDHIVERPDPLMRSGLSLAGANVRPSLLEAERRNAPEIIAPGVNDGLLLSREVVDQWNLKGTSLVALIGCVTGSGELLRSGDPNVAGEGIASMRHAVTLSGAEAVLASSWTVALTTPRDYPLNSPPTDYTTRLLLRFFSELRSLPGSGAGAGPGLTAVEESLRTAQLALIREGGAAGHPYFWASFSVTGP